MSDHSGCGGTSFAEGRCPQSPPTPIWPHELFRECLSSRSPPHKNLPQIQTEGPRIRPKFKLIAILHAILYEL